MGNELIFNNINKNGVFHLYEMGDIEYASPIEYWETQFIEQETFFLTNLFKLKSFYKEFTPEEREKVVSKLVMHNWEKQYNKILNIKVNENLIKLLSTTKKNEQERLLKGLCLSSSDLISMFFYSYLKLGYKFSNYTFRRMKGVSLSDLPKFAYIEENREITIIGNTILHPNVIKQAINSQHRLIVRFIDNGEKWHCFFQTMKGISGKESGGQSHIHYISDRYNLSREEVLNQFKNEKYRLPKTPHINFYRSKQIH